ncbi:MAG: hypothetical protein JSU90_13120 [Nitrospiraceae bacterium]|nr:MAG: hypothetical protein JSU90_13120 [Nitrospiraceae bacterium]
MAIDGLNSTYGIPAVKEEQRPGTHTKKKEQRRQKERKKKQEHEQKEQQGRVDIRV